MPTSPKQAKTALAAQIQAQTGLACSHNMPNVITPPCAAIFPGAPYVRYGITLGEGTAHLPVQLLAAVEMNLIVAVFVQRTNLSDAQDQVDDYIVTVADAIFHDATLGGIVEWAEPGSIVAYNDISVNDQTFFHAKIAVNVSITPDLSGA